MTAPADIRNAPEFIPRGCVEASINDKAREATGWVVRTFLLSLLEASRQDEGLSILENKGPNGSVVNGCTEGLEGVGATCIEVGGIEPL